MCAIILLGTVACNDRKVDEFQGYIEGDFIHISSESSGEIKEVYIRKGERIKTGDKILSLDDEYQRIDYKIKESEWAVENARLENLKKGIRKEEQEILLYKISQAKSEKKLAESRVNKMRVLHQAGHVSSFELEQNKNDLYNKQEMLNQLQQEMKSKQLPAREDEIEEQKARLAGAVYRKEKSFNELNRRIIYSHINGEVADVIHHSGEWVAQGARLISILPADAIKVRFFVPEDKLHKVIMGKKINILTDNDNNKKEGTINYLSPKAEFTPPVVFNGKTNRRVFLVEAKIINRSNLKPGVPVRITLE